MTQGAFPEPPDVPAGQRAEGVVSLRYEDVAQDGRLHPLAVPHALGEVMWAGLLGKHPMNRACAADGIVPILSRVVIEGQEGPVGVRVPLSGTGAFQLAHARGKDGNVARILLNLWVSVYGAKGRTYGEPPAGAGDRIPVGRVFAEHVFSRPFGAPDARKVLRLPEPLGVPADAYDFRAADALLELSPSAESLEPSLSDDPVSVLFGLCHTDSNQHVNSLVYPRLFEQAALRRLDALGLDFPVFPSFVELGYRKPFFAGERARLSLRAFRAGGRLGVLGAFAPVGAERPSVTCRMHF